MLTNERISTSFQLRFELEVSIAGSVMMMTRRAASDWLAARNRCEMLVASIIYLLAPGLFAATCVCVCMTPETIFPLKPEVSLTLFYC